MKAVTASSIPVTSSSNQEQYRTQWTSTSNSSRELGTYTLQTETYTSSLWSPTESLTPRETSPSSSESTRVLYLASHHFSLGNARHISQLSKLELLSTRERKRGSSQWAWGEFLAVVVFLIANAATANVSSSELSLQPGSGSFHLDSVSLLANSA